MCKESSLISLLTSPEGLYCSERKASKIQGLEDRKRSDFDADHCLAIIIYTAFKLSPHVPSFLIQKLR